jgi:hypothetical protein
LKVDASFEQLLYWGCGNFTGYGSCQRALQMCHNYLAEFTAALINHRLATTHVTYIFAHDTHLISRFVLAFDNYRQSTAALSKFPIISTSVFEHPSEFQPSPSECASAANQTPNSQPASTLRLAPFINTSTNHQTESPVPANPVPAAVS